MAFKFNPLTGKLDLVRAPLTKGEIIQSILLDKDENAAPENAYIEILFDEDSILFNDDNEDL
jgi:hypothetical protein